MISSRLKHYLDDHHVPYQRLPHMHKETAYESAVAANVSAEQMTKAVILKDIHGFLMAVIPADSHLNLFAVNKKTGRDLHFAHEDDIKPLFSDCELGAIPAMGDAYNMEMIWDTRLAEEPLCFLEAGDHSEVLALSHDAFMGLVEGKLEADISH